MAVPTPITPTAGQMAWWLNLDTHVLAHSSSSLPAPWLAFNSAADAKAYGSAHGQKGFSWNDLASAANPLSALSDAAKIAALAWKGVSDGTMWRSLAWIIGGVVLLLVGVALWIEGSINPVKALM